MSGTTFQCLIVDWKIEIRKEGNESRFRQGRADAWRVLRKTIRVRTPDRVTWGELARWDYS